MLKIITMYLMAGMLISSSMAFAIKDEEECHHRIAALKPSTPDEKIVREWSPAARRKCTAVAISVFSTLFGMYLQSWLYPQQCFMHPYGTKIYWSGGMRPT